MYIYKKNNIMGKILDITVILLCTILVVTFSNLIAIVGFVVLLLVSAYCYIINKYGSKEIKSDNIIYVFKA